MLDVEKLKEAAHKLHMSEEEFIAEKKRLAAKILHLDDKKTPRNGIVYILLAFFFGAIGLHNFYAGYWGRGLSQLCLSLIAPWFLYIPLLFVSIWVLLELLFVNKDPHGKAMKGNRRIINLLRIATIVILTLAFYNTSMVIDDPNFQEVMINV